MKKLVLVIIASCVLFSCDKTTTEPRKTDNKDTTAKGCGDGYICFKLDGTEISKQAGGYELSDTNLFVKYEDGGKQLSIDIFGKNTGNYSVSSIRKQGNGRIYYFPEQSSGTIYFMAETGKVEVNAYDAANKKVTGTFSGTLYNYDGSTDKFIKTDSIKIADGKFTTVSVPKI